MDAERRDAISPWQIRMADELLKSVEGAGRMNCELTLRWASHDVVRVSRDTDGLHVEFPQGGVQ